jgi:alanine racemase
MKNVRTGTAISYGGIFRAKRPSRIATVPIGYADGYTRRMTGRAQVLCGGRRCPVVGAVSMDMIMIDVTAVPEVKLGDEVVLLGSDRSAPARITIEELADWAGTIPWEICCAISKRVPRIYTGDNRGL